ncbi:MAG: cell division protein FtsL [Alphaproteobacteria bacterium]
MTRLGFALSMLAVVATAAWAYNVNYRTKTTLGRVDGTRSQIAAAREAVGVLRVEWAYLNAPDRLARMVARHNGLLGLGPMGPQHFGDVAEVPFRPRAPGSAPGDVAPETGPKPVVVISESVPPVSWPVPMPRPVGWRLE